MWISQGLMEKNYNSLWREWPGVNQLNKTCLVRYFLNIVAKKGHCGWSGYWLDILEINFYELYDTLVWLTMLEEYIGSWILDKNSIVQYIHDGLKTRIWLDHCHLMVFYITLWKCSTLWILWANCHSSQTLFEMGDGVSST